MADLSSILGGMVQGFKDFGTGLVDLFGTGGAAIGDAISSIQTGRATTKNQDDFRKWLYNTDSTKDAAAKGLGTALNGVSTVADVIPGAQAVTANPLFNGLQGAIGGVADELKMAGENADLGRAAQRAGVGAASGLASGYAGQALGKSGNKLLSNGLTRGAVSGALGGGIANAGYTGIEGGSVQDMINAGLYGAQTGALVGGTTGLARELIKPTYKMDARLTDTERQARIENAQAQIDELGPVPLFSDDPEYVAKRARKLELNDAIKAYRSGYDTVDEYNAAMAAKRANRPEYKAPEAQYAPRIGEEVMLDATQAPEGYTRLYRGLENEFDPKYVPQVSDNGYGYESWSDTYDLAREYAGPNGNVYTVDVPNSRIATQTVTPDGERMPVVKTDKKAGMKSFDGERFIDGKEYLLNVNDPLRQELTYSKVKPKTVADLMNEPKQKTVADLMLSPEQKEYFKDSVVRDENGNLMPLYHGSNSKFTVFDSSKGGQSNKTAKVGHWFTPSKDAAEKWAGQAWWGDNEPSVYETYLNIKKPMVYESVDNSAPIKKLEAQLKQAKDRLDSTYRGSQEYYDAYREYNNIANEIDNLSYTDPYEQFRSHIYAMEGKTPSQANAGGVGMAMNDEDAAVKKYVDMLKSEGYDGIIIKGTGYDQKVMGGPNDQYVVFDSNQIKDVNNLKPTADADIMHSKVAPGQLGLFDQPIAEAEAVDAVNSKNPYAPVDGKVTKAMKDRYNELMASADGFSQITDNELYNKMDRSTLPKGYDKLQQLLDNQMGGNNRVAAELKKGIGTDMPLQADLEKLADYVYGDEINGKNTFLKDLDDSIRLNRKNAEFVGIDAEQAEADARSHAKQKLVSKAMEKAEKKVIDDIVGTGDSDDILYALQNYRRRGIRTGRAGALDTALSERLGIAPGNTVKVTDVTSDDHLKSGSLGRYARNARDIALSDINSPEGKISTMAHERLHSFQNEARPESAGRYSPEVAEAYRELQKDLGHHYKSHAEIRKHWKKNVDYYASSGEQESRMFQQYLENKGYTDNSAYRDLMNQSGEWGNEINPAFDKFINKLRALSKKGVALPALTALFGGGAIMAATQGDDKKKKSEVK